MPDETSKDDRRLHALSETMRAFAEATTDYERLLETVAERMSGLIGDGAFVAVASEDGTNLEPVAVSFRDGAANARARAFLTAGPIRGEGSSLGARVVRTRAGLRVADADIEVLVRQVSPNHASVIRGLGIRSLLVVPLELRDRALGFVSLARLGAEAPPFSDNDEAVARNLAEHAALAIANAQLLQSVQRELEQRRRAEESAARFGALIEHSGEFIAMATLEGKILFINRHGRALVGLAADEDLQQLRLSDFHTEEGMKRAPIIQAVGRWQGRGQLRNVRTGELIDTQVSSFLVRDTDGKPFCYATVQHDVRETKKLEAQLRQAQKMEAIGTLAGGIAHDFNNIIGAILSNLELARLELGVGHPAHEMLDEIAGAGNRAVALVRQILTLGRERESTKRIIRLGDVLREAMALLRSTIPARAELIADIDEATPNVSADPTQVHQIIMNLCTNAWQALEGKPGRIVVELAATVGSASEGDARRRWARLRVIDDGHGMDAATVEQIFDPFFTTKAPGEGTGLGLSVVHGLVKDHGGTIRVESAPGRGSLFEILLPAADSEVEAAAAAGPRPAGGRGRRLLFLDDEGVLVRSMEALLRRAGYEVRAFTDPDALVAAFRAEPRWVDLVLTDYNMPRLSGLDVAKIVRAVRPELPVILLSGFVSERLRVEAAGLGITQLLHKPCSFDELRAAIDRHTPPRDPGAD
jgi:PAS domain S-box-containing protein